MSKFDKTFHLMYLINFNMEEFDFNKQIGMLSPHQMLYRSISKQQQRQAFIPQLFPHRKILSPSKYEEIKRIVDSKL